MAAEDQEDLEWKVQRLIVIARRATEYTGQQGASKRRDQALLYSELYTITKDRNDLAAAREAAKRVQNMQEKAATYARVYSNTQDKADLSQAWATAEKVKSPLERVTARIRIYYVTRDQEDLALARMAIDEVIANIEMIKKQDPYAWIRLDQFVYNCTGLYQMTGEERLLEISRDIARSSNNRMWGMWCRIWEVSQDENDRGAWQDSYKIDFFHYPLSFTYLDERTTP